MIEIVKGVFGSDKGLAKDKRLSEHFDRFDGDVLHGNKIGWFEFFYILPCGGVDREQLVQCLVVLRIPLHLFFPARKRTNAAP